MKIYSIILTTTVALLGLANSVYAQNLTGGEVIGRHIFGLAEDFSGDPLMVDERPQIYHKLDFDIKISVDKSHFSISGFNQAFGSIYITEYDKSGQKPMDTNSVDLSGVNGLYFPSGGVKTRWGSVLSSESKTIDAHNPENFIKTYKPYFKGKELLINAYNYGWTSEIILLNNKGLAKSIKNYAVGRLFADQIITMPDGITYYMLDSSGSGNLYMFIAEQANSLAKGSLYVLGRDNNKISYTLLGKSSALKLKFKLKKIKYDSIFKTRAAKNQHCPKKYTYVNTLYGEECLLVQKKNKKYAGLFEPIRMAAINGISSFTSVNTSMRYLPELQQIRFTPSQKQPFSMTIGKDSNLNIQYAIKEPT